MLGQKNRRKSCWDRDPAKIAAAEGVLRDSKRLLRDPDRLLRRVADGIAVHAPTRSAAGVIAAVFEAIHRGEFAGSPLQPDPDVLRRLCFFCRERTDLLTDTEATQYSAALVALAAHHQDWVRPLDRWRAASHNARRQLHSLIRHLIARYDMPTFMDAAWLEGLTFDGITHQRWFKLVAGGRNIRTADDLPIPLTRRQAHLLLQAPDDFDILSAFRWAVIMDLGGDERLVRSILQTRVGTEYGDEPFWTSVFRFFVAHPMLDPFHHGPIIDYILSQKHAPLDGSQLDERLGSAVLPPVRPCFRMKGRTVASLLRAVGAWHVSLARAMPAAVAFWAESGFPAFACEEEADEGEYWLELAELLSAEALREEGQAMHHCVASYAGSCATRRTSIWSLRRREASGPTVRIATIEVSNNLRTIVQVRRKWNRPATEDTLEILDRWADEGGPRLSYRLRV